MDSLKLPKIKIKYVVMAGGIISAALLVWLAYSLIHHYREIFRLSESINKYSQNVTTEKIDGAKAQSIIDFLNPATTTEAVVNMLISPFKIPVVDEPTAEETTPTSTLE